MPDPSPSTLTVLNSNYLLLGRRSGGRPQRTCTCKSKVFTSRGQSSRSSVHLVGRQFPSGSTVVLSVRNSPPFQSYKLRTVGTGRDFSVFSRNFFWGLALLLGPAFIEKNPISLLNFSKIRCRSLRPRLAETNHRGKRKHIQPSTLHVGAANSKCTVNP